MRRGKREGRNRGKREGEELYTHTLSYLAHMESSAETGMSVL